METSSREPCDYSIISISEAGESDLNRTSLATSRTRMPRLPQQNSHLEQQSFNYMLYSSSTNSRPNQHASFANRSAGESVCENIISIKKPTFNPVMSSTDQQCNNQGEVDNLMSSNFTAEGVWEAYNEKCRECERLRDDLEESRSQVYKMKSISRKQTLEEEKIVSSSTEKDRNNEIEYLKMLNDELKSKNLLAKDELERTVKYYEREIEDREEKHESLMTKINDLKVDLAYKEVEQMETLRDWEKQNESKIRQIENHISNYKSKISDLDEQLNRQKEKCAQLESAVNLSADFQRSTGLPSICSPPTTLFNSTVVGGLSTGDLSSLVSHVRSLNEELISVKRRAHVQREAMDEVCRNPIIAKTLQQVLEPHSNGTKVENQVENDPQPPTSLQPPTTSLMLTDSSLDNRQIDGEQEEETNSGKVDSFQPKPSLNIPPHSPHNFIEIPKDPDHLSEAFKSLQNEVKKRECTDQATDIVLIPHESDVVEDCVVTPASLHHQTSSIPKHFKAKWPKKPTIVKSTLPPPSVVDESFNCISSSKTSHRHPSSSTKFQLNDLPPNHPSKRPLSRAYPDQAHSSRADVQLDAHKKMYACPVCEQSFDVNTSNERVIRRHVNGHFSDADVSNDDDDFNTISASGWE